MMTVCARSPVYFVLVLLMSDPRHLSSNMKRKSWFRRSRGDLPPTKADDGQEVIIDDQDDPERLRPLHFSPNRIATLYVTPSERNLYLAAMSALDKGPPPLPLWSESPPTLPLLPSQPPNGHFTSSSTDWTHLTTLPKSPKFVTSPDMPEDGNGLTVRDEFRRIPPRSTKYAFLSLNPPSGTRFTGFPVGTFLAVDAVFLEKWPAGVRKRSESFEGLRARGNSHESLSWTTELSGKVWKRKGHQELEYVHYAP